MPVPPQLNDNDGYPFPVRGKTLSASISANNKMPAQNLGDGAETQHVYISRPVVAFSNRTLLTERQWRQGILDTLKNAGGRLPDADGLAHALIEAPFHDHNDTPGEARNYER